MNGETADDKDNGDYGWDDGDIKVFAQHCFFFLDMLTHSAIFFFCFFSIFAT